MITDQTAPDMEALRSRLHTEPHLQQLTVFIINLRAWEMWNIKDRTWNANVRLLALSSRSPGSQNTTESAREVNTTFWHWWTAWRRSCWRSWPPSSWAGSGPAAPGPAARAEAPPSAQRPSSRRWCWDCRPASAAPHWTC